MFVQNVIGKLGGASKFGKASGVRPGEIKTIKPELPYPVVDVRAPDKAKQSLRPKSDNSFVYANTENCGIYEVIEPETNSVDHLFAVNLMDRRESNVRVQEELEIGFEDYQGAPSNLAPVRKEYWPWLVGLALTVLIFEWYVYNRRVFI